jgi:acyl carrier protein
MFFAKGTFVRNAPFAVAPLRFGYRIASHVLGHSRLIGDRRVLEILEWHARPRRPQEVAEHFGESERAVAVVLAHLAEAQLLVPAGFDARARIRSAFASRRVELPTPAPSLPLTSSTLDRWNESNAPDSELERAAFGLTPRTRLSLSAHVVSLGVRAGETIALHPLGRRVHLKASVWRLAQAFRSTTSIEAAGARLGVRSPEELLSVCRFLVLERLLWPGRACERRAFDALATRLGLGSESPSALQWSDAQHQWTDVATPMDWEDVARTTAFGRVAVVGQCQINFVGAALQRIARRHHVHLDVFGEAVPSAALAQRSWAAVFVSLHDGATELRSLVARGLWAGARDPIAPVLRHADELVTAVRKHTGAPVAFLSVAPPTLSPLTEACAEFHARARLYAELNDRLARALGERGAVLIDVSRTLAARAGQVVVDDEYTSSAHHCTYNPRFWIELTQWAGEARGYPAGDPQAGAAEAVAPPLFDFLRRRYERTPVRVVAFDPDTLLWPGRLADRPAAHEPLDRALGRPDYQYYCGVNEALLAVRARGVKLVCVSPLPEAELRAKWNVPESSTAFVSAGHLDGTVRTAKELRQRLAEWGLEDEACLSVGLGESAETKRGRVFGGDPWSLRRYLLTAPELTSSMHSQGRALPEDVSPPDAEEPILTSRDRALPVTEGPSRVIDLIVGIRKVSVGPDDNLYDAGFTSLDAVALIPELEDAFEVSIPDDGSFLHARTPRALHDYIERLSP